MRWSVILLTALAGAGLLYLATTRLKIDSDILSTLPHDEPVLADTLYVMAHHPVLDRVFFDLHLAGNNGDTDTLLSTGDWLKKELESTGLFKSVGVTEAVQGMPQLLTLVVDNLPAFFDRHDLEHAVAERLHPKVLSRALEDELANLSELTSIGQSDLVMKDPLSLREIILARMSDLLPTKGARFTRGHLISPDGGHLLLIADPQGSGTDSRFAARLEKAIEHIHLKLRSREGPSLDLVPVGSYRAALDNERVARSDTERTIVLVSVAIVLLLLLCFPRPVLGLFALVPALFGTVAGLFVYSLFKPVISLLALGFGGAIVSITVDHGIAYLLFLNRKYEVSGRQAAHEVWSVGLLATLTTTGAFLALLFSGFPVLEQLGLFAALGVTFSFIFVHTVFPLIFPRLKPIRRKSLVPIHRLATWLALSGRKVATGIVLLFAGAMATFAPPDFRADLQAMNTVSEDTLQAEAMLKRVWGDVLDRVYLLIEGNSMKAIHRRADQLLDFVETAQAKSMLDSGFSPSQVVPGPARASKNLAAWRHFWSPGRVEAFRQNLLAAAEDFDFAPDAFDPFIESISKPRPADLRIPEEIALLLGIFPDKSGKGFVSLCPLHPGPEYQGNRFHTAVASLGGARLLDPTLFSDRLSALVVSTFSRMLLICGAGILCILLFFFLGFKLPGLVLTPVLFSLICTMGTLKLIGHPLDIPGLLLAIVAVGMGIDYALFLVRSHQRYLKEHHESLGIIRSAVLLASLSTLIGFGALALADHALLRSAGLIGVLAIAYSLIGAFFLLPPMLRVVFRDRGWISSDGSLEPGSTRHRRQVLRRYRHLEAYPRQFARFKMVLDPMFSKLHTWVGAAKTILDVGCGYGVPGTWLAVLNPTLKVYGLDPNPERVRVAKRVLGERGKITEGKAPNLPPEPDRVDAVLLLDMIHYLTDQELETTLEDLHARLAPGGRLIIRVTVPTGKNSFWKCQLKRFRVCVLRIQATFRTLEQIEAILRQAGFQLEHSEPSAKGREETWFIATAETA
jgi:predicted exporter/SAM-dependent methyltransferase